MAIFRNIFSVRWDLASRHVLSLAHINSYKIFCKFGDSYIDSLVSHLVPRCVESPPGLLSAIRAISYTQHPVGADVIPQLLLVTSWWEPKDIKGRVVVLGPLCSFSQGRVCWGFAYAPSCVGFPVQKLRLSKTGLYHIGVTTVTWPFSLVAVNGVKSI